MVVLSFRSIDLESDNLCRYDYVDVYSGHVSGQRLGRFCGTFKPGALVSTGNKMLMQMVSDANTAGSGFLAVFSAAHPHERGRPPWEEEGFVLFCFVLQWWQLRRKYLAATRACNAEPRGDCASAMASTS